METFESFLINARIIPVYILSIIMTLRLMANNRNKEIKFTVLAFIFLIANIIIGLLNQENYILISLLVVTSIISLIDFITLIKFKNLYTIRSTKLVQTILYIPIMWSSILLTTYIGYWMQIYFNISE